MGPFGCYHIRIISWNQNRFFLCISNIDSNTAANSNHLKYNLHRLHFKVPYWDIVHVKWNISIHLICSGGFIMFRINFSKFNSCRPYHNFLYLRQLNTMYYISQLIRFKGTFFNRKGKLFLFPWQIYTKINSMGEFLFYIKWSLIKVYQLKYLKYSPLLIS